MPVDPLTKINPLKKHKKKNNRLNRDAQEFPTNELDNFHSGGQFSSVTRPQADYI